MKRLGLSNTDKFMEEILHLGRLSRILLYTIMHQKRARVNSGLYLGLGEYNLQ
jgi:hypothetical protein